MVTLSLLLVKPEKMSRASPLKAATLHDVAREAGVSLITASREWIERYTGRTLCETTLDCLEQYVPGVRERVDWVEASTPRTFQHYTRHLQGASFGTKFEGLKVSMGLPEQIRGLYHAGSVGIIMSGWLGSANYGVITSHKTVR